MHPLEVITSFWYPNIIWGEKLLYSHFPPYLPRGEKWLYSHFSGGNIYYIAIFPPIQVRGKYGYIAIFPGGMAMGGKWLYNTGINVNSGHTGYWLCECPKNPCVVQTIYPMNSSDVKCYSSNCLMKNALFNNILYTINEFCFNIDI